MKKIFNIVARRATLLAAVMLAAFSFSLSSCSDDDDPKPETTELQIEKIAWFYLDEDGNISPYGFDYYDKNLYSGVYIQDETLLEFAHSYYDKDIALYDIVLALKADTKVSFTKTSATTGKLTYDNADSVDYELSKDGNFLTLSDDDETIKYATLKGLGLPQGKIWNFKE